MNVSGSAATHLYSDFGKVRLGCGLIQKLRLQLLHNLAGDVYISRIFLRLRIFFPFFVTVKNTRKAMDSDVTKVAEPYE